ncbi:tripartite tricarboxylate transporter substrate binding protein [Spartinivicinus poritis]|uniref:Tripartite tricarboxylate transporter substrate-binding protein n=1 Tax=Spartinivicinus poritis TaxID=2994640 RepID=A0ABT5UGR6_9GAMM|nr:tripartite tricarboxylate transporter substrate-binding protein [Spartinivicinus sp. A2-2]MDE1464682.1 tripartite tricarboxylate transporter substrate-binding protein [Spartinivicinus sp. A2-2]
MPIISQSFRCRFIQLKASLCAVTLALSVNSYAEKITDVHFLVPGGAGGGWDSTARATGSTLKEAGLINKVSYQNLSGGGGGKAIAYLIETAKKQQDTLMVNSTPIVIRSLAGVFPQTFRDLTPIAATIADYGAFIVKNDAPYKDWKQLITEYKKAPAKVKFAGGSTRGSMDHLIAAAAVQNEGLNPRQLRYVPYDAGAKAMAALLSGETQVLSTGFGEALELAKSGQVRILAITAPERLKAAPDVPTLKEMGNPTVFANWRGFFAAPNIAKNKAEALAKLLADMQQTPAWNKTRDRYGWIDNYKANDDFIAFLNDQEKTMRTLMQTLGFLKK